MYRFQYKDINIDENSKILIGLGDSFTQGQGACSEEFWEKYDWDLKKLQNSGDHELLKSEYEGSWVNQLCKNHLTDYIPINFGLRGCGNRSTVKELYLHPELNIEKAKEKIVVFMLTGMERFDFVNKDFGDHHHFFAMWPNPWDKTTTNKKLWEAYAENIWSDSFGCVEVLLNIMEVKTWCKANNAKLVLTSAFSTTYNEEFFKKTFENNSNKEIKVLNNLMDWSDFLYPEGFSCFSDYLVNLEERPDLINFGFYSWAFSQPKMSPKKYFTKCAHPSYLGHKKIAEVIYKYIQQK